MTNWKVIESAVKMASELFEAEGIMEDTKVITNNVLTWYNKTDVTDPQMLAAAAISGPYRFATSWDELVDLKEFYFPSSYVEEYAITLSSYDEAEADNLENISIWEIEESYMDYQWR